mmetsp:Transcript_25619/g.71387  ORF Transcript_25619/g.71387 Transcript_25619/m.71387 type:complete len:252 (+) Transcript_25619:2-757(+)
MGRRRRRTPADLAEQVPPMRLLRTSIRGARPFLTRRAGHAGLRLCDFGAPLLRLPPELVHLHTQKLAVFHEALPLHPHVRDLISRACVDDVGHSVEPLRRVRDRRGGPGGGRAEVHRDHVRLLADREAARDGVDAEGLRPAQGRHPERDHRRGDGGVLPDALGEQRREPHLRHHVEGVVGGRPVGAQRDVDTGLEKICSPAHAASELQARCGAVDHVRLGLGQVRNLLISQPVHVHSHEALVDHAEPLHVL